MRGVESSSRSARDAALAKSPLATVSASARDAILAAARPCHLASKEFLVHRGDSPRCCLIVDGLMRAVSSHADGRDLTLIWASRGEIMGFLNAAIEPAGDARVTLQAVTDIDALELPVPLLRDLCRTDATVARAVAVLATAWLGRAIDEMVMYAYGDLRERIMSRLLEFACREPVGTPLVAQLTQEELAEAVGATRPSVGRVLKELRDEGLIRSMYGGILILRPEALTRRSRSTAA